MTTPKPALPEPDLLVECAQGFVRGWTELKVRAAIAAAVADARAEIANLKTVMIAAAEEIAAHWDAHCDAEGCGPQNLMRRLEEGIPSEYGYTAGAFAELKAKAEARAVPEGCACRWDADDNRVQTCERHQGWLDVIAEWADRARAAEAALAATPSPAEQPKPAAHDVSIGLARGLLWLAYVWNDHNFEPAHKEAQRIAANAGINSFEEANAWLATPSPANRTPDARKADKERMRSMSMPTQPARVVMSDEQIYDATEHIDTSRNGYFIHIARAVIAEYERLNGIATAQGKGEQG